MVKRNAHTLTQPKASTYPEHVIFLDTETIPTPQDDGTIEQVFRLGVAIACRFRRDDDNVSKKVYRFDKVRDFWEIVRTHTHTKSILYLLAHNAVFDFIVVQHIEHLTDMGYKCKFVFDNNMTFIAKWSKKDHSVIILNTANWFQGSVKRWGESLNLNKMTMPEFDNDNERWYTYCERDADILYQLFVWYLEFIQEHNLGSWKFTIASSAFYSYRYRFMKHPIYIPDNKAEIELARASYHGGRSEVFRVGEYNHGPYYKLDINSMYPFVMKDNLYPTCLEDYGDSIPLEQLEYLLTVNCVIADVTLNCTEPYFVYEFNHRNIYPVGHFRTVLTSPELRIALENDWIKKVHRFARYRARDIFGEYVTYFHGLKQRYGRKGKGLLRNFTKLYLNSLYGKFGQRGYVDKVIGETKDSDLKVWHCIDAQTLERYTLRQVGTQLIYSQKKGESYNAFASIASHVTAYARCYLYTLITIAGRERVFYCDTDSIICDVSGYSRIKHLCDNVSLGQLRVEAISDNVIIVAPKHYKFADKWVRKGVRKDAYQLSWEVFVQETWPGFNTILKSGKEVYYNYFVKKVLSPSIETGVVDIDGYVIPFTLDIDSELCM